ncbi:Cyclopentanol dehydrogenase [Candidatus Nitrosocosmicus oleophilus]|jgi:NAD(P)-dependent dehydrogenase (short-subunit alcohol dehydrogenase family)|uniref:Cyclopentanol dehydrogenase n=1 Tax=Candidatus Nitrosocosmicus oleophilus TaxID=1353260 RepID=A0A654LXN9_9ARCH|nr:SDR family oxidoreductase [Candidatus Nitrosocosmicus oleophilus]ALI35059.1 Cyclopentanol dehydrogenase [Candidatus Nitrosocosmicus oleophilus]
MTSNQKVAVVTGSSSGIGHEIALILARNGFLTYATMRDLQKNSKLKSIKDEENLPLEFIQLDVTDENSVKTAVQKIYDDVGRIDMLINNAGYGLTGAFEDLSIDEIKTQFETNFYGLIRTTQAILPIMRKQKSGTIVNMSSGAGRFGFPMGSAYVSTKFAVEGLSESLSYEVEPFGIRVILIEPGMIKTNFSNASIMAKKSIDPNSSYAPLMKNMQTGFNKLLENASSPQLVAQITLDAMTSDKPNLRYLAGKDVEQWVEAKKKMSDEEFHDMIKQI